MNEYDSQQYQSNYSKSNYSSTVIEQRSLKEQFSKATKDNKNIQDAYTNLWKWHGECHQSSEFRNYCMQGDLKKRVQQFKFWQKGEYNKRFFVIDFTVASILIKKSKDETKEENCKVVPFRNIESCYVPTENREEKIRRRCSKTFKFPFYLKTLDRLYELCTTSDKERTMWIAGFNYIIVSTTQVQNILKDNDQKLQKHIKKKTENIQKRAIKKAHSSSRLNTPRVNQESEQSKDNFVNSDDGQQRLLRSSTVLQLKQGQKEKQKGLQLKRERAESKNEIAEKIERLKKQKEQIEMEKKASMKKLQSFDRLPEQRQLDIVTTFHPQLRVEDELEQTPQTLATKRKILSLLNEQYGQNNSTTNKVKIRLLKKRDVSKDGRATARTPLYSERTEIQEPGSHLRQSQNKLIRVASELGRPTGNLNLKLPIKLKRNNSKLSTSRIQQSENTKIQSNINQKINEMVKASQGNMSQLKIESKIKADGKRVKIIRIKKKKLEQSKSSILKKVLGDDFPNEYNGYLNHQVTPITYDGLGHSQTSRKVEPPQDMLVEDY